MALKRSNRTMSDAAPYLPVGTLHDATLSAIQTMSAILRSRDR